MCSCFLSFPRFYQYHLPVLKSILSFLKSSLRSFYIPRRRDRSSDDINTPGIKSSTSKRPVPGNIRAIVSSRIGGRGRFMDPASVHATDRDWIPLSDSTRSFHTQTDNVPEPTHGEDYEGMAGEQHSHVHSPPASHDQHTRQSRTQSNSPAATDLRLPDSGQAPGTKPSNNGGSAWWKKNRQSNGTRTGYWDVLSFFHTNTTISPGQSKMQSENGSNAASKPDAGDSE